MSRLTASTRMSTQTELLAGIAILAASLLMRAVASVSGVGPFRDVLGVFSVLLLLAGVGVVAVGLVHRVTRAHDVDGVDPMSRETMHATGAVIGVGIGCTVGATYGGALPIALGTAIGAAAGIAAAFQVDQRAHRSR
jgi:hypothetical protein